MARIFFERMGTDLAKQEKMLYFVLHLCGSVFPIMAEIRWNAAHYQVCDGPGMFNFNSIVRYDTD